jgi:anti-sigma B factor antagonist
LERQAVEVVPTDAEVTVRFTGDLDMATERLIDEVMAEVCVPERRVVFDASFVDFVDSTGLRVLLRARQRCLQLNGEFALRNPSERLVRLLEISGLTSSMDIAG